jgi:hypothetical protein
VTRIAAIVLLAFASSCGAGEQPVRDGGTTLERYGITVTAPPGWHARLTRATVEAETAAGDLLVRVFEYEPETDVLLEIQRTHPDGRPGSFTASEFGPPELGGDNPNDDSSKGQGFARRNFSMAGRSFDLFVESAPAKPSENALAELNELVESLEVEAGDFYPGTIEPPRFAPASGWHTGSHGGGEIRATDHASAWASTAPYRNGPRDLPPAKTLEELPQDGILIWIGLARDNRFPPTGELRAKGPRVSTPLEVGQTQGGFGWEGQVREISLYRLWGWVEDWYSVDLWIFYGRREPTDEQREWAQGALDRLHLPDWGRWELDGRDAVEG